MVALSGLLAGCGNAVSDTPGGNETAASVNGKAITLEEVERAVKQQAQGQEGKLSPLELAAGRLQVLQSLIEQEVMYQKAEKEGAVPSDEEVTGEFNKRKTASGLSAEQFDAKMKEIGETEATARLAIKKGLAIQKLNEKVTGKIEPPKDNEIATFFNNNPEAFKNKRGAQLAAIVIDPRTGGQGGNPRTDLELQTKVKDVVQRLQTGADFATVARETSEDSNTAMRGGDWRYFTEEEMKQAFPQGFAETVMTKMQNGQVIPQPLPFEGRYVIVKLQRKQETDEARTLETPGVRQEITDFLINSRKQLLAASYQALAMNEAKVENFLAQKVVANPNELSGARPASAATPANSAANMSPAGGNVSNIGNLSNVKPAANTNAKANTK
jgi:parvulin-like peptidyl-prolyl isomerase